MKWLAVALVLLGIAGNTPAGSLLPCPQSQDRCPMACCVESEMDCCAASQSKSHESPLQAPVNTKDLQVLCAPLFAPTVLMLPVAEQRVPALRASAVVFALPSDRLATLCSFLI